MARCPFHDDKRPSLSIDRENGLWYCHGCQIGGNPWQFAKLYKEKLGRELKVPEEGIPRAIAATYTYQDETGKPIYQVVRFEPKDFRMRKINNDGTFSWNVWKVPRVLYHLPEVLKSDVVFVVEGEKDTDNLLKLFPEEERKKGVGAVTTVPGGAGKWLPEFNDYLKKKTVFIIPDNDPPGLKHAVKIGNELEGIAKTVKIVQLPGLPEKGDISDWIERGGTLEEFLNLCKRAPGFDKESFKIFTPREEIVEIRKNDRLKAFERKTQISQLIIATLQTKGKFYCSVFGRSFYFDSETKRLTGLDSVDFADKIAVGFGINSSEEEFRYLMAELEAHSRLKGERIDIYQFAHYNPKTFTLYVYNNGSNIYKITEDKIELVPNGTEGVLFIHNNIASPFVYQEHHGEALDELILGRINFSESEDVRLFPGEQRLLLKIAMHLIFFESLLPTKVICTFIGPTGSGKTMTLKWLVKLFLGEHFSTAKITKEDAFAAALANNYLLFYDNVDSRPEWLNDALATASTGGLLRFRRLYTTNEEEISLPRCFIFLDARDPKFRREDVARRLLLFRVDPLVNVVSEGVLIWEILEARDTLWSELIDELQKIVSYFKKTANIPAEMTPYSMADFYEWGKKLADLWGETDVFEGCIKKMLSEQSEFVLGGEIIADCLDLWLENPRNRGRWTTARELYSEWKKISDDKGYRWLFKSSMSLAKRLENISLSLQERFILQKRMERNRSIYNFQPK